MQFPIFLELRRSVVFAQVCIAFHFVSLASACILPWPWIVRLLLVLLSLGSCWKALRAPKISALRILGGDRLDGVLKDGSQVEVRVCPQSVVYRHLIVLQMRVGDESRVRSLVVFSDQMPEELFRRLRLWLRAQVPADPMSGASGAAS